MLTCWYKCCSHFGLAHSYCLLLTRGIYISASLHLLLPLKQFTRYFSFIFFSTHRVWYISITLTFRLHLILPYELKHHQQPSGGLVKAKKHLIVFEGITSLVLCQWLIISTFTNMLVFYITLSNFVTSLLTFIGIPFQLGNKINKCYSRVWKRKSKLPVTLISVLITFCWLFESHNMFIYVTVTAQHVCGRLAGFPGSSACALQSGSVPILWMTEIFVWASGWIKLCHGFGLSNIV